MIKFLQNDSKIKSSNLVYFLENKKDLSGLNFLGLDKNILLEIDKNIGDKKNILLEFFIGTEKYKKIYIFLYLQKKEDIYEFLGENFRKLPNNFTLILDKEENNKKLLESAILGRFTFEKYKTGQKKEEKINFIIKNKNSQIKLETRLKTLKNIIEARKLVETPSCDKTPEKIVKLIKGLDFKNTKLKILSPKDLQEKGLNLINAVGSGSKNLPYLVILEKIIDKNLPYNALVGKGVTFDAGGLNLKTDAKWLYPMKDDMGGAATVLYLMKELDEKNTNTNLIAAIPLAENLLGAGAYRPSDIITAYNGKTVEIIDTDAEGRLVMADAMSYISQKYELDSITTVATLTGACLYALGFNYAGIMGNNKKIIDTLLKNSKTDWEKYWLLPFSDFYIKKTIGELSDFKNLSAGIFAGSTMGGAFLSNFCDKKEKFTHIDIAGTANIGYDFGLYKKGATGFGIDSLSKLFI